MTDNPDLFAFAELAARRRDAGMALAVEAQDANEPEWSDQAYAVITDIARRQDTVHVDDVLAEFSRPARHPNAWGAIWMRAIRAGIITRTGTVRHSTDPAKHKHNYPVYRSNLRKEQGDE